MDVGSIGIQFRVDDISQIIAGSRDLQPVLVIGMLKPNFQA
jgi:hypothetical protein